MHWGDVSSWVAVVVSVAVAGRAVISERRAKSSADRADEQRQRTVAAAERSAQAVEDVAAAIRDSAVGNTAYQGPTWDIEHRSGDLYALINQTPFTQTEVAMSGEQIEQDEGHYAEVKAFCEVPLLGLSIEQLDDMVTVEWTDQNGDRQQWSKPLPPKR